MKQSWQQHYPEGVPHEIDPDVLPHLPALFAKSFQRYRGHSAYASFGVKLSFDQLDDLSARFAAFLQHDLGLVKGDRIALQMPNVLQYPIALIGALRAGCVVVNTNPLYTADEMHHQFADTEVKALVILENFAHLLHKVLPDSKIEHVIITGVGDQLGGLKGTVVNLVLRYVKRMVPSYSVEGAYGWKDCFGRSPNEWTQPELAADDVAFLQYTGGTTGVSKGAMLTHRNLIANLQQMGAWMKPVLKDDGSEITITALPMYHIFSLTVNTLLMLHIGAMSVLIINPRDMKAFIKDMAKYRFTVITGVNTLFNGLLNQSRFLQLDLSPMKVAVAGGMALQPSVNEAWKKATGIHIAEGYGLTETSPLVSCNPLDGNHRDGSIGVPVPNTEVQLLDEAGKPVPAGEPGELAVRGPQVMKGYLNRPEDTAEVMTPDGFFKTGDVAIMSEDGFISIVDRRKEMINVSGFNVYPNEVEAVVAAHPKVLEVGCIGIPSERSGEAVMVCVVPKEEGLTEEEIRSYCREHLTGYKVPKRVEFRTELPKSNVGKIMRRLLREDVLAR